ncbi:helix-turn-helix transcriptional regulator [Kitasatospora sp. NPDC050463]|uniref:helix-turn-helix domain-containing protein n=1 Tax=Kitasatospora sp. NPDC050463 TaxID=3155786 RepID=UPI0033F57738
MGRPQRKLDRGAWHHRAQLALWLREHKQRSGLTYREMAQQAPFSATVFSRAASGQIVPTLEIVEAFATVCRVDPTPGRELWKRARHERARAAGRGVNSPQPMRPEYIRDHATLRLALIELHQATGELSLRELERRAQSSGDNLSRGTIHGVLKGRRVPTRRFVGSFVRACGIHEGAAGVWLAGWDRAERRRSLQTMADKPLTFTEGNTARSFRYDAQRLLEKYRKDGLHLDLMEEILIRHLEETRRRDIELGESRISGHKHESPSPAVSNTGKTE